MSASGNSERRRLLVNAAANWTGFATQLALAFYLSPILVHGLGDRRNGIWALVESILSYLMLFDLGVAASVVRYVARFEAARDQKGLNQVFSTSLCIFGVAGALVLAIALGLAWAGMRLLDIPADLVDEGRWMLALLGLNLALGLPLGVFASVLDGLGRYPLKTAIRTASLLARSALYLAIMRTGGGLVGLAWAITACNVAEHLALAVAAWWCLPGLRFAPRLVDWATFRTIRGYSLDAFLTMLASRISFQTDALVIGYFLLPEFITFFTVAARLVEQPKASVRAVTSVLTPAMSAWEARGEDGAIRRTFLDGTRWVLWVILPLEAGLFILGKPFLTLWMGPKYALLSFPTLCILALPLALAMSQSVSARVLYGTGRLRWFRRMALAEALANLGLSLALVVPFGIEGVAWGTTIPDLVANLALAVYVCRLLHVPARDYLVRAWLAPLVLVLVPAGIWLAGLAWVGVPGWTAFLTLGAAGMGAYLLLAVPAEYGPGRILRSLQDLLGGRARTVPAVVPAYEAGGGESE
jgi:O-antigen/teichoic acid export membrane protein